MAVGREEVEIVKPRSDKREYRRVVLENSLEVLLISDPDTDKCAASMDVGVGSFSDPEGLDGLAHFLEHMLFYASEKYPVEDSYSKFIAEHGGTTNAVTFSTHTNYHFDVNVDSFEEALDRFAQFFIKPLMSPDATMREIKAVHSEYQKNLLLDRRRMNQLQKHISEESHPYHKFSTGNWDTLEIRPRAKGLDIRNELIEFYKENYSANLMHLVVYSKENLDEIYSLVEDKFQEIRNTDKSSTRFPGVPCSSEHLQILVTAVPIKQGHKLRVIWPVTPEIQHYKEGPCRYLGHLIGHRGEGSLFYVLKTLGWASSLFAGDEESYWEFAFFTVEIDLTDAGHEHVQDILGLLFKYIILLGQSGVCKSIFDELSALCETKFHYQDKIPPIHYVANVASNMEIYPPEDWIVGSSLPCEFNPGTIQVVLDKLSPDNVRIFWESKSFEGSTDMVEPWYGTAYSMNRIPASSIQEWISSSPDVNLHLPVNFSVDVLEVTDPKWHECLVGYYVGKNLPFKLTEQALTHAWGPKLVEVMANDQGFFFFHIPDPVFRRKILEDALLTIGRVPLFLRQWKPLLELNKDNQASVLVWIRLKNLPLDLWSAPGISAIASVVGKPLYVDQRTEQMKMISFARVCVEIYAKQPRRTSVDVILRGVSRSVSIEYEWRPVECPSCGTFGHRCADVPATNSPGRASQQVQATTAASVLVQIPNSALAVVEAHEEPEQAWK